MPFIEHVFFSIFRSILHLQRSFACFVGRYIAKSIWNSWNWSAVTRVNAHESSSNQLDTFMRFIILCAHFIWCQTKDSDLTTKNRSTRNNTDRKKKKKYRRSSSPIEATHCLSFADTYFYISSSKAQKSQNNWIKQVYGWFYWKDQAKRKQ